MKEAECGEEKATRQCWECLKRRLVCDHTLPHCKKCEKAGKVCPGYAEQKPLQWVQLGKVTSRRRKKNSPPLIYTAPLKTAKPEVQEPKRIPASCLNTAPNDPVFDPFHCQQSSLSDESRTKDLCVYLTEEIDGNVLQDIAPQNTLVAEVFDTLCSIGGREQIEKFISNKQKEVASQMVKTKSNTLKQLERILRIMQMCDIPNYGYLTNDTNDVVQAVHYFNFRIYPTVKASGELVPNPAIINFPLATLHVLPPAVHHTLVCLSLNHFNHSLPIGTERSVTVVNRSKIYHHRGAAIRALSEYVGKDKTRCSDLSIASILLFMSAELQNSAMSDWRSHAGGMKRLVDMRGGMKSLMQQAPYLVPTLVVYILIVTTGNTCSPSWDQISLSETPQQNLDDISKLYNLIFPYSLCPPTLFFSTIQISQLRASASTVLFSGTMDPAHSLEAQDLLTEIESFIPEDWAQPGEHYEEWLQVGTIYQSAVALYCTMAFQSLTILPSTLEMNAMRCIHGDRLLANLRIAMETPRLVKFMMWPMVVAGVEAGYRGEATQYWIAKQLSELSRLLGTSSPLKAEAVLRRYWQKEEKGWDECFDRPYVFVV